MDGVTVNGTPLLAVPPTVTTTFPEVARKGTGATMLVAVQLVGFASIPLKVTVLVPCVEPKFTPEIVTEVPVGPAVGERLVIPGPDPTMKSTLLLGVPPTVTTTFPVVAPLGTFTTMVVVFQLVAVPADTPLNLTVLVPCVEPKLTPPIVTELPTDPEVGFKTKMAGPELGSKTEQLLDIPPTVTRTHPMVAPAGTGTTMLVALQLVGVASTPLNVTFPVVEPKFVPVIVTDVPGEPEVGLREVIVGGAETTEK